MKIFFDFDDTLFDTRAFAESIQGVFEKYGISKELFWSSYQDMKGSFLVGWCYSPEIQIQKLKQNHSFDAKQLRAELDRLISETKKFLFSDTEEFLSFFKKNGYVLYILSFGDYDFQMKKICGTGIDKFIEKIIITKVDKAIALREEITNDSDVVWFVDDKIKFIEGVKDVFPKIRTVLMRRAGRYNQDKPNDRCDYVVANLNEMAEKINESVV